MSRLPGPETRSSAHQVLASLKRWRRRNRAIRELRTMDRWRLADLGLSRDQIPALVDAMLEKQNHSGARIAPTEVQATRTGWMLGPWADGLAGP
jgi:uncharacterized protein YjiS (DUF1127 family)